MNQKLKKVLDTYMEKVPEVKDFCNRCLKTERWDSNIILMIVDAAFDSIGLNYFKTVVPNVEEFRIEFMETGRIKSMEDLVSTNTEELRKIWRNRRSWSLAKSAANYLINLKKEKGLDERKAFIYWAKRAKIENWENDPIGMIRGVGINTFQYLRMMGGVDTVMPDKVVKKVIYQILKKAGLKIPSDDQDFVKTVEKIGRETGYKPIELCWMTWLVQSEAGLMRIKKYSKILPKI